MSRKVSSIVVLYLILVATIAEANPPSTLKCGGKCALNCAGNIFPPLIALCFTLCMVQCKRTPSAVVYDCTNGCAKGLVTNFMNSNSMNPNSHIDVADRVAGYVESCYNTCSRNNI